MPIGWWVLREACSQIAEWQSLDPAGRAVAVSVNISGKQFSQPDLVKRIRKLLRDTQVQASCLSLEMTESTVMDHGEVAGNIRW